MSAVAAVTNLRFGRLANGCKLGDVPGIDKSVTARCAKVSRRPFLAHGIKDNVCGMIFLDEAAFT